MIKQHTPRFLRRWRFPKHRLEAFSDGVFAIVITLLVLELKVPHIPHSENTEEVIHALWEILPKLFSWFVSFFFIAFVWLHHHQIMNMSTVINYKVVWINIILLFFLSLLPFPTALMGEYPKQPLIVMIWGFTLAVVTFWLACLYAYCTHHFLRPTYHAESVRRNVRLSFITGPLLYVLAGLLAWWSIKLTYILYMLVPILYVMPLDKEREDAPVHAEIIE
jgi:uncharacterized membrane protein